MASAYDANVSKVEVTGRAPIVDNQVRKARRHALEDALYFAALKTGADISSTAITSQGILIRDIIKLDTQGKLIDFNIQSEKNTGTHYEVELQAFFARKASKTCSNPRYPGVRIMMPRTKVSSNVHVLYAPLTDYVAEKIIKAFLESYSGPISQSTERSLSDVKSVASTNVLFDYQSLQSTAANNLHITEEYMLDVDVFSKIKNKRLESHIKLELVESKRYNVVLSREHVLSNKLPIKTPLRSLNVLMPKSLEVSMDDISALVSTVKKHLEIKACDPLEAKTIFASGKLKLGIGSSSGVRNGTLAYVTNGSESWTLLEVSDVTQTSATLKPINLMSKPKTLANQTVRFIEGAL